MRYLKILNCQECPFCNNDNEFGYDSCNLKNGILMKNFEQMPYDKIHNNCPLKINDIQIGL